MNTANRPGFGFSLQRYYRILQFDTYASAAVELESLFELDIDFYLGADDDHKMTADCIHRWATLIEERKYEQPQDWEQN